MTAHVLLAISILLPLLCLPLFLPAFFFPEASPALLSWFVNTLWIGLFILFFIICPFIGINGVQLAKEAARNGYKTRAASLSVLLMLVAIALPIVIAVISIVILF